MSDILWQDQHWSHNWWLCSHQSCIRQVLYSAGKQGTSSSLTQQVGKYVNSHSSIWFLYLGSSSLLSKLPFINSDYSPVKGKSFKQCDCNSVFLTIRESWKCTLFLRLIFLVDKLVWDLLWSKAVCPVVQNLFLIHGDFCIPLYVWTAILENVRVARTMLQDSERHFLTCDIGVLKQCYYSVSWETQELFSEDVSSSYYGQQSVILNRSNK